ncbi:hypothetical protein CEXT_765121 [Caerostris extrusa]|uniref:Uncharacterized protein n=1 Tax=Caerostris extrusa TaxID=172846 RepID=A0AAV4M396_CAEEX|nr:hypothetical protein CEXT_765121 [Caerostris extrusa]
MGCPNAHVTPTFVLLDRGYEAGLAVDNHSNIKSHNNVRAKLGFFLRKDTIVNADDPVRALPKYLGLRDVSTLGLCHQHVCLDFAPKEWMAQICKYLWVGTLITDGHKPNSINLSQCTVFSQAHQHSVAFQGSADQFSFTWGCDWFICLAWKSFWLSQAPATILKTSIYWKRQSPA